MAVTRWASEHVTDFIWNPVLRAEVRHNLRKLRTRYARTAWNAYRAEPQELKLPSAPERPVVYLEANDRPQPRFDIDMGAGMTTAVGRLRPCSVLDWKFTVLSHNTIRGAAGAALLNAELLKAKGYLG